MPKSRSEFSEQPERDYNMNCGPDVTDAASSAGIQVIAPLEPPQFGPAAARALLRLLVEVHRAHCAAVEDLTEET